MSEDSVVAEVFPFPGDVSDGVGTAVISPEELVTTPAVELLSVPGLGVVVMVVSVLFGVVPCGAALEPTGDVVTVPGLCED